MHIICKRLKPYEFHFNELVKPSNQYFYRFYCVITGVKAVVINLTKFFRELGAKMWVFISQINVTKVKDFLNYLTNFFCEINWGPKCAVSLHKFYSDIISENFFATNLTNFHVKSICTQSTLFDFTNFYHDFNFLWKDVASSNLTNFHVKSIGNQNYVVID